MRPGLLPVVCLLCLAPQSAPAAESPLSNSPTASTALPPDAALRSFQIEPGFQIDLFASEPMVQEPVAITFDPDGRLWVVEMRGFMPDLDGTDELAPVGRVSVLEDTNADGQADLATVFLDQLVLPRAIAALPGGILIADHRRLLYALDLDGDLRADSVEVVDPDYAPGANPEHQPNGLLPALDNWIYNGESRFRYRLLAGRWIKDETELRGQWGITQDDRGRLLYNYNWSQLHADLLPPNYLNRNPHHLALSGINVPLATNQFIHPIRPNTGVNRGDRPGVLDEQGRLKQYASACAPLVYRGNQFPPRYRGNVLICDPAANIVRRSVLSGPPLAPFATNGCVQSEFLASTDERFRPVWLANGPDGALYLADMYRGIIQHKAYMTPHLRQEILARNLEQPIHLGRIYRITHSEGPAPHQPIALSKLPPARLLDLLSHPNAWHRESAQRLLIHHVDSSLNPDLLNIALHGPNSIGRLHALWTLEGRQFTNAAALFEAIHDPDPAVQAGAIRILEALCQIPSKTRTRLETTLTEFSHTASEPIRLQAILSLGNLRPEGLLETFLEFATLHSESPLARDALVSGLHGLEMHFLQRLLDSPAWDAGSPGRDILIETLTSVILRDRDPQSITGLLAGFDEPVDALRWQHRTVLKTLHRAASARRTRPIALPAEPPLFNPDRADIDDTLQAQLRAVSALFTWPGRPSTQVPVVSGQSRSPRDEERFHEGRQLYIALCAGCHGAEGEGIRFQAPPLVDSQWVLGPSEPLVRILLHGLEGPITVGDKRYEPPEILPEMPGLAALDSSSLTAIITYIRQDWGHAADPIPRSEVQRIRLKDTGRTTPWTEAELLHP